MKRTRSVVLLTALLCWLPSAARSAPPLTITEEWLGRGTVTEPGTILPVAGLDLAFGRYQLAPRASTGWHGDPGAVLLVVNRGAVTVVEGPECRERLYKVKEAVVTGSGWHLLHNQGSTTTEVVVAHVALPPGGPTPYLPGEPGGPGCATKSGSSMVEVIGRGVFDSRGHEQGRWFGDGTEAIEVRRGLDVTFQEYAMGPHWHSGWHNHPGPAVGVVTKGNGTMYEGHDGHCQVEYVKAGDGLVFYPDHAHWATNESFSDDIGLATAYVNVPRQTEGLVPGYQNTPDSVEFRPPPSSCPVPLKGVNTEDDRRN